MKERKDLQATWIEESHIYFKDEADAVMDAMEAKIKELEANYNDIRGVADGLFKLNTKLEARIKELEASQPKWVSVKERLPMDEGTMLVCDANNGLFALIGRDANGVLKQLDDRPTVVATDWMPLHTPPKSDIGKPL